MRIVPQDAEQPREAMRERSTRAVQTQGQSTTSQSSCCGSASPGCGGVSDPVMRRNPNGKPVLYQFPPAMVAVAVVAVVSQGGYYARC